jgi:Susd and RagB outer membrane lipoprotein
MNYKTFKIAGLVMAATLCFSSCTKNFEEINKNPYGSTDDDLAADFALVPALLQQAQRSIYLYQPAPTFQLQQNLLSDIYSGYMMSPTPFGSNINNTTYSFVDGWINTTFATGYTNVMNPCYKVAGFTKGKVQDSYAMSLIIKVEAMHRTSDIFGPIIYSKYNKPNADGSIDYDSQKDVYYTFFDELKTAIDILTPLKDQASSALFTKSDLVYGGSYKQWLQFANTLRLRLALRIVNVDLPKAKLEGEAALANAGGLLQSYKDNFTVDIGSTTHPLNTICGAWGDILMGAPMGTYLNGYSDPRLPLYFQKATDPAVKDKYIGIRNGINIDGKARYGDYSKLVTLPGKLQLVTAAEAWFLKSEAAIRGWANAGNAQTNYETGILTSFAQYSITGAAAANYLVSTALPAPYIDPKAITPGQNDVSPAHQPEYLSTITVKWDDAATPERKLERIITQKWIANFPEGEEAWAEFRRTGYPKLFPVIVNNSGGKVSTTDFVRRAPFPSNEYATNGAGVTKAVATLTGGQDVGGAHLWWDPKK